MTGVGSKSRRTTTYNSFEKHKKREEKHQLTTPVENTGKRTRNYDSSGKADEEDQLVSYMGRQTQENNEIRLKSIYYSCRRRRRGSERTDYTHKVPRTMKNRIKTNKNKAN